MRANWATCRHFDVYGVPCGACGSPARHIEVYPNGVRTGARISVGRLLFVVAVILAAVLLLTQLEAPEDHKHCTVGPDWRMKCTERES
jgi:hypothetical protein